MIDEFIQPLLTYLGIGLIPLCLIIIILILIFKD